MNRIWNKIKTHWGISSNIQATVILLVFAVTGFSTLYSHRLIDYLLGINEESDFWLKLLAFVFLILPIYTFLLYFWGIILGQRKFFTKFIKLKLKLLFRGKLHKK